MIASNLNAKIPNKIPKIEKKAGRPFPSSTFRTIENPRNKNITFKAKLKEVYIFVLALKHQLWRRCFYLSHKDEVLQSFKDREGECKRCGGCCKTSFKCPNLDYDESGLSCCKINHKKPHLCKLYPYNQKDFFKHLQDGCGYRYKLDDVSRN